MKGVWWIVIIVAALVCPLVIQKAETLRYNTVTFNFEGATPDTYLAFVNSLRNAVRSKVVFGLPVTAKTVPDSQRYVLVDLKFDGEKFITIAVDVTSLYVVGYRDKYEEKGRQKERANFLSDAPPVAKRNLFTGATVRDFRFTGSYHDLRRVANTGRENIQLGVNKLQQAIESVYGKSAEDKTEAKFFIISIQMVSEAARYGYILRKVLEGGIYGNYKPDLKAISLETSWDKISKAIQSANPSGIFSSAITLKDEHGNAWTVTQLSDIAQDMGLSKFLE